MVDQWMTMIVTDDLYALCNLNEAPNTKDGAFLYYVPKYIFIYHVYYGHQSHDMITGPGVNISLSSALTAVGLHK